MGRISYSVNTRFDVLTTKKITNFSTHGLYAIFLLARFCKSCQILYNQYLIHRLQIGVSGNYTKKERHSCEYRSYKKNFITNRSMKSV